MSRSSIERRLCQIFQRVKSADAVKIRIRSCSQFYILINSIRNVFSRRRGFEKLAIFAGFVFDKGRKKYVRVVKNHRLLIVTSAWFFFNFYRKKILILFFFKWQSKFLLWDSCDIIWSVYEPVFEMAKMAKWILIVIKSDSRFVYVSSLNIVIDGHVIVYEFFNKNWKLYDCHAYKSGKMPPWSKCNELIERMMHLLENLFSQDVIMSRGNFDE